MKTVCHPKRDPRARKKQPTRSGYMMSYGSTCHSRGVRNCESATACSHQLASRPWLKCSTKGAADHHVVQGIETCFSLNTDGEPGVPAHRPFSEGAACARGGTAPFGPAR